MKILFISTSDVLRKHHGGELCTNRNYLSFCNLVGEKNVTVVNLMETIPSGITNALKKRINYLKGYYEGLSNEMLQKLTELANQHDIVFINTSCHGSLAYYLKKQNYKGKIISFFHNIEYNIQKDKLKMQPWKLLEVLTIKINENRACKYSDSLVALNDRDGEGLKKIYKTDKPNIIPISLTDSLQKPKNNVTKNPPTLLFTGNNWYANIHGINWFIENVLDHVDIKLQITGHRMDKLSDKFNHPKIEFLGFVDDLASVMAEADYIILPIFIGSGMKVKTCEALMHGKNIIGTQESFEGYNIQPSKVGALCETKEEFIESINSLCFSERSKFNPDSRDYFLNHYSFEATLPQFKSLLY